MDLNKLTIQEKVGQRFMIGVNSYNIDIVINLIKKYYIGGVILYKKNYNTYNEMLAVIKRLKQANESNRIPLFISIDQEGGRVNRLPSEIKNIKNIYDMSRVDSKMISDNANITGEILSSLGINMNLAPVLDLNNDNNSKVLYKRCFCGDASVVSELGNEYIKSISNHNVIPVIKHFPGHGVSKRDSHIILPYVYNYEKILENHIKPFDSVIKNGVDALMVGHLVIRNMTKGLPASISYNFINEYIRKRYNYDGLIITDEINMLSHNLMYKPFYMRKAMLSGSDIILLKIKNNNMSFIDKYISLLKDNNEYMSCLDDSVKRIIRIKDKYKVNDDTDYDGIDIVNINKKIDTLNNRCCDNK